MSKKSTNDVEEDEVEQLLRAAQDDMLLKLSLNSHSVMAIHPDLDRRFQALKKEKPKLSDSSSKLSDSSSKLNNSSSKLSDSSSKLNDFVNPTTTTRSTDGGGAAEGDDLFARFAALKNSHSKTTHCNDDRSSSSSLNQPLEEDDVDDGDEVQKLIKWAIDAARLDPSPPSDDDDDEIDRDTDDDDDDDDDDDHRRTNGKIKGKR